jgi:hypothetical protein
MEHVTLPANLEEAWSASKGSLSAVSDGSFKEQHGTAAWMIYVSESCIIRGTTITPGSPEVQSAYRSELIGLYGIAYTIRYLQRNYEKEGSITVGCDGLSALNQVQKTVDFINPNERHFDIIMAVRTIVAETTWDWHWKHVKGHQDEVTACEDLDRWSKWNIEMDKEAKKFWETTAMITILPTIQGEPWRTITKGTKISSNLRDELRVACTMPAAMSYWGSKKRFGKAGIQCIDWEAFGAAMAATPANRQKWVSKTISGFCATGRMMHRRKERESDACPRCGESEDMEHVWLCKHDTAAIWEKSLDALEQWLLIHRTHPEMTRLIIKGLQMWRTGEDTAGLSTDIPWLREVITLQNECGWRNLFEGLLVKGWQKATALHLSRIRSPRSSRRWTSAFIRKMWQVAWDLWEHRNGYLHEADNNLISQQVNQNIELQFQMGTNNLDRETKKLFKLGARQVLVKKPLEIRQQWLRRVQAARLRLQNQQGGFRNERRVMANWLGKATGP